MRKNFGKNIFISLYLLIYFLYLELNSRIYMNLLLDISTVFLILSIVSVLYSIIFKDRFIKIFYIGNIFIIFMFLGLIIFLKPDYTYDQAKQILKSKTNPSDKIIDHKTLNDQQPGVNILLSKPKKNLFVIGDYRFFVASKDNTRSYKFDSMNGDISIYNP